MHFLTEKLVYFLYENPCPFLSQERAISSPYSSDYESKVTEVKVQLTVANVGKQL